jgi:FAD/FMN-containing dehydrogenase
MTDAGVSDSTVGALRRAVRGLVLVEGDDGYDQRCLGWNRLRAHRPAVVVVAADADDVIAAVRFATDHGMGLGVQATGHGMALPVDGLLLDTSAMTDVVIDLDRRTATLGAGCPWGPVLAEAQRHGLAPLLGSSPTVGAVGYTLGGGVGWLARKHGAACDRVRWFDVVTPDAALRRASPDEEPDLFRALRGGGGAFGVVTAMEVDLVPVSTVYAGNLYYPGELAADIAAGYGEWVAEVPDELTSSFALYRSAPPLPAVPESIHGRPVVVVRGCWCGDITEGRALLDRWRREFPPLVDRWDEMPFTECATISNDRTEPTAAVLAGEWLARCDGAVGAQLAEAILGELRDDLLRFIEVRHLGAAVARADRAPTSFGHRHHPFFLSMAGLATGADPTPIVDHQGKLLRALGDAATGDAYLNYLDQDARRHRTRDAFEPDDQHRLAALQRRLDPGVLLRYGPGYAH